MKDRVNHQQQKEDEKRDRISTGGPDNNWSGRRTVLSEQQEEPKWSEWPNNLWPNRKTETKAEI